MTVLLGARDEQRGKEAAAKLQSEGLDVQFLRLDVNDQTTHKSARSFIEEKFGKLDILVNNAGIALDLNQKPSEVDMQTLRKTFDTNFFGVISVTQALLPLIHKSDAGRIVNVSSGLGSLTQNSDPGWEFYPVKLLAYNSSKTALNARAGLYYRLREHSSVHTSSADNNGMSSAEKMATGSPCQTRRHHRLVKSSTVNGRIDTSTTLNAAGTSSGRKDFRMMASRPVRTNEFQLMSVKTPCPTTRPGTPGQSPAQRKPVSE